MNVFGRVPLFGARCQGRVVLNEYGRLVKEEWLRGQTLRSEIALDSFVVMPDHLHGIVVITRETGIKGDAGQMPAQKDARRRLRRAPRSLGGLVAGFKSSTTRRINLARGTPGVVIWQSNYYEQVIRSEKELLTIREYIKNNPLREN